MTTALVTGANKGIGLEIVKGLVDRGLTVYLGARDPERGERAAASSGARFVQLDVTDPTSIARAAAGLDRLDILINNAGISGGRRNAPGEADLAAVREVFDTNVFGVIAVTDAMLPLLRASESGRIVNMSSVVGSLAGIATSTSPNSLAYVPSKSALNAVTALYAKAEPTLKVNAACPGYCATDLNNHAGHRTAVEGAAIAIHLATLDNDGPTGGFFNDEGPVAW
ncbi:NAD(P)-dependent dehydrogenase (short-subunit alcohol dehydrogenase family) [Actinokineospora baliensis]|uniref:SDR family oxidoreductase n=1 Tax=Actinokineospora baliensis TaxID=547056 RepID=UPI0019590D46|nr:SDR family oxidoreductase [Actinokineospora baliensis]MBM7774343.1 NAD(P)-dependent dehydrogenase (short-subunit alcohol dehydrogenase family) [Actinokineospora baliensis]